MRLTRILHPTDFSDGARHALKQAVRLALAHGSTLHVFHAVLLYADNPTVEEPLMEEYAQAARNHATQWLPEDPEAAARLALEVSIVRRTSAFDAIMEKIAELTPDVVVMGTHGRSGLSKFLMGSETEKILRHAPGSVMTLRPDARLGGRDGRFHQLLVPVDLSDASRHALVAARALIAEAGGSMTLLHVLEPIPPLYYAGGLTSRFQLDSELSVRVTTRLAEWAGQPASDVRVVEGIPTIEIPRVADEIEADLIVIGHRGHTGMEQLLVGSVTEAVCRFARAPVLAVR